MAEVVIGAVVSAAASTAVGVVVGSIATTAVFSAFAQSFATSLLLGGLKSMLGKKSESSGDNYSADTRNRQVTLRSAIAPRRVIVGETVVSGPIVFGDVAGAKNSDIWVVIPLAGHECEEISDLYLNEQLVPSHAFDVNGKVTEGPYANVVWMWAHLGSTGQTADTELMDAFPDKWTAAHRLRGVAYVVLKLKYDDKKFPTGMPNIKVKVKGKKGYDPRDAGTRWTPNPALCLRDYFAWEWGLRADSSELNDTLFSAAANLCDERVAVRARTNGFSALASNDTCTWDATERRVVAGQPLWVTGASLPAPLVASTVYYCIPIDDATFKLAATLAHATAKNPTAINLTTDGTGSVEIGNAIKSVNATTNRIELAVPENAAYMGFGIQFKGTPPTGLAADTTYYCVSDSETFIRAATTYANALARTVVDLTATTAGAFVKVVDCPRYTANGSFTLDSRPREVIEDMLTALVGQITWSEGKWDIVGGAYTTPSISLDETAIAGGIRLAPKQLRRNLFNEVRGVYQDRFKYWQATDFPPVQGAAYVAEDGGEVIGRDIQLPYTGDPLTAQRIAKIILLRSRLQVTLDLTCNLRAFKLKCLETCELSIAYYGYTDKVFRVLAWELSERGAIALTLQEEDSSVYAWDGAVDQNDTAVSTPSSLPSPLVVPAPTTVSCVSGNTTYILANDGTIVPRIKVSWDAVADVWVLSGGRIDVQIKKSADSEWQDAPAADPTQVQTYLLGVSGGVSYDIQVRNVNAPGYASDWVQVLAHVAQGKTDRPDDVSGFTVQPQGALVLFRWNMPSDEDLAGTELRYVEAGSGGGWGDGATVTRTTRGTQVTTGIVPPGDWVFMAKHIDTSGNESLNADSEAATVTNPNYVVWTRNENEYWETGTLSNLVIHPPTRCLVTQGQTDAYDAGWDTFDTSGYDVYTSGSYTMPATDIGRDAFVRVYAAILSGLLPGAPGLADPETEIDTRLDSGSFDGWMPWDIGTDTFRHFKFRIVTDSAEGRVRIIDLVPAVDVQYGDQQGTAVAVPAAGLTVTYDEAFFATPNLTVTPVGSGDYSTQITAQSDTGFTVTFRSAGTAADGTVNWRARGALHA